jgi:hypothetical protein
MRRYTDSDTSGGRSICLTRTSTTSTPELALRHLVELRVMISISWSRSPDTTSWIVRIATWLRSPSLIRCDSRPAARDSSPFVAL